MARNWREAFQELLPGSPFLNEWAGKLTQYWALLLEGLSQGATEALYCFWLDEETSPDDAVEIVGRERNMPRYPGESVAAHRARLLEAWDAWDYAGNESSILGQFEALGLSITIHPAAEFDRPPFWQGAPWKSQFWIILDPDQGFAAPPAYGDPGLVYGGGRVYGMSYSGGIGSEIEMVSAMRYIVKKWKSGAEICRSVIASSGIMYGDGHTHADGSVYGGFVAKIDTL